MNSNEDILNLVLIGAKNSGKTYFLSQLPNSLVSANDSTTRYLKEIKGKREESLEKLTVYIPFTSRPDPISFII